MNDFGFDLALAIGGNDFHHELAIVEENPLAGFYVLRHVFVADPEFLGRSDDLFCYDGHHRTVVHHHAVVFHFVGADLRPLQIGQDSDIES